MTRLTHMWRVPNMLYYGSIQISIILSLLFFVFLSVRQNIFILLFIILASVVVFGLIYFISYSTFFLVVSIRTLALPGCYKKDTYIYVFVFALT